MCTYILKIFKNQNMNNRITKLKCWGERGAQLGESHCILYIICIQPGRLHSHRLLFI